MMKKINAILLAVLSVFAWFLLFWLHYKNVFTFFSSNNGMEKVTYILTGMSYVSVFACICDKVQTFRRKGILAVVASVIFTVQAFLLNNYLRYFAWNLFFDLECDGTLFLQFLKNDILYMTGWGKFRYPLLLCGMVGACMVVICWKTAIVQQKLKKMRAIMEEKYTPLDEGE